MYVSCLYFQRYTNLACEEVKQQGLTTAEQQIKLAVASGIPYNDYIVAWLGFLDFLLENSVLDLGSVHVIINLYTNYRKGL